MYIVHVTIRWKVLVISLRDQYSLQQCVLWRRSDRAINRVWIKGEVRPKIKLRYRCCTQWADSNDISIACVRHFVLEIQPLKVLITSLITSFLWRHWFKLYALLYKDWTNDAIEMMQSKLWEAVSQEWNVVHRQDIRHLNQLVVYNNISQFDLRPSFPFKYSCFTALTVACALRQNSKNQAVHCSSERDATSTSPFSYMYVWLACTHHPSNILYCIENGIVSVLLVTFTWIKIITRC